MLLTKNIAKRSNKDVFIFSKSIICVIICTKIVSKINNTKNVDEQKVNEIVFSMQST